MKCPQCSYTNLSSAVFCIHCNAPLTGSAEMASGNRCPECGSLNLPSSVQCVRCGFRLSAGSDTRRPFLGTLTVRDVENRFSGNNALLNFIDPGIFNLNTQMAEIEQIFGFVIHSPHITTNSSFKKRAQGISLIYLDNEDIVNAFASDHEIPEYEAMPPFIGLFKGLCNASKLSSLAAATCSISGNNQLLIDTFMFLGGKISQSGEFSVEHLKEGFSSLGFSKQLTDEIQRKARSYFSAILLSVISHEIGHICYNHTLGKRTTLEVSRNQERDADSFASSVISTTPFSDYNCYGSALWWMVLTWVEENAPGSIGEPTTHPISRERLLRLLSDNESQFKNLNLTVKTIDQYLPRHR